MTADDVAERISRAAWGIETLLVEVDQVPGLREQVASSPHLVDGRLSSLRSVLDQWGIEPLESLAINKIEEATLQGEVVRERTTGAPLHAVARALGFPDLPS